MGLLKEIMRDFYTAGSAWTKSIRAIIMPKTRKGLFLRIGALVLLFIVYNTLTQNPESELAVSEPALKTVPIASVSSLSSSEIIELIGTVESASQADIQTEVGGRVTSVTVALGGSVSAGEVIATLENANEFAAVLQAEGVYEAALAASAQNDVSVEEAENALSSAKNSLTVAKNNILNVYRTAYTNSNSIVLEEADDWFVDPEQTPPGLRLDAGSKLSVMSTTRIELNDTLRNWRIKTSTITTDSDLLVLLVDAETNINRVLGLVDQFIEILPENEPTASISQAELDASLNRFTTARTTLLSSLTTIQDARTTLIASEQAVESTSEALRKAEIGGTANTELSASNAQVKQALGSLRAAEANLAKTILRSPISGSVNELTVKTGDFLSTFTSAALVANNNALEIITFVGDKDRDLLSVGDTVSIENEIEGIITAIAPAVDSVTKKVQVKIATESTELENGDSVRVSITDDHSERDAIISVPLSAVKFTANESFVFMLNETTLERKDVVVGDIKNGNVVITEGLTGTDEIIIDARGLSSGQQVEGVKN